MPLFWKSYSLGGLIIITGAKKKNRIDPSLLIFQAETNVKSRNNQAKVIGCYGFLNA
jgi:hypothetical protein